MGAARQISTAWVDRSATTWISPVDIYWKEDKRRKRRLFSLKCELFLFFTLWTFYLASFMLHLIITNCTAPEKRARASWKLVFCFWIPHFKMGRGAGWGHLSDSELMKETLRVWAWPSGTPRGPEDPARQGRTERDSASRNPLSSLREPPLPLRCKWSPERPGQSGRLPVGLPGGERRVRAARPRRRGSRRPRPRRAWRRIQPPGAVRPTRRAAATVHRRGPAPAAMARTASSERRWGLNLASAWSSPRPGGRRPRERQWWVRGSRPLPGPAAGAAGAHCCSRRGRAGAQPSALYRGVFPSPRWLWRILAVRVGASRGSFRCQRPDWRGVGGALRSSPDTPGPGRSLLGRQRLPLWEENNYRLLTAWKLFRRNDLWNILILINCFPRGPLLSLERPSILNFTGSVSIGKIPLCFEQHACPPPPPTCSRSQGSFFKGVFHSHMADLNNENEIIPDTSSLSCQGDKSVMLREGEELIKFQYMEHPVGVGYIRLFLWCILAFLFSFSFFNRSVVNFCAGKLLDWE